MLNLLRKSAARKEFAMRLEGQLAARAREPFFFRALNVPDTVDGRFDMVALHGWLALERLKAARMEEAAQGLTDALFLGFDEALREQGTGDMGMGRRMKAFANAFFGRLHAYSGAKDETALAEALAKNIWRGKDPAIADWCWRAMSPMRALTSRPAILPVACWISARCPMRRKQSDERVALFPSL